jgi:hypothetical protein
MSTSTYTCTITTDALLTNVTFFIPVPATGGGNSPIIGRISDKDTSPLPEGWKISLYDTGKATYVKITAAKIEPPAGTKPGEKYSNAFTAGTITRQLAETRSPVDSGVIFRPVQNIERAECPAELVNSPGSPTCYRYLTTVYADYDTVPAATVIIDSAMNVKNEWTILKPEFSEYRATISLLMFGSNHGWTLTKGWLETNIGTVTPTKAPTLFF